MHAAFWNSIISAQWKSLVAGHKIWITVPLHHHPKWCLLFRANAGWPVGQSCDYTISYGDGSRLHVQCFGAVGGQLRLRLHRDRFDPDQGFLSWILHGLVETPVGPVLAGAAVVLSVANTR